MKPTRKVTAGALAGALTVLIVYLAGLFGLEVPTEASSALTLLLSFLASYVTPSE